MGRCGFSLFAVFTCIFSKILYTILMTFIEMEKDIAEMSSREKALLFKLLADDLSKSFPGIEKMDGVSGGSACIVRTRIPVWTLELARRNGLSEAQLLFDWPSLRAADLVNAWSYSVLHKEEIEKDIEENLRA